MTTKSAGQKIPEKPSQHPKDETLGFDLELTFPSEIGASADALLETIVEAIYLHDSQNRLLPGIPMPRSGERLVGSAIRLVKREIAPAAFRRPPASSGEPSLGMKVSGKTLQAMLQASLRVDSAIEDLREAQASLWVVHNELLLVEHEAECRGLEQHATKAIGRIEALLPRSMP